jgi:hypothetical protein
LLLPDGGAHDIATIDTSGAAGANIIAIFGQWGAIQLLLAALLWVLIIRYPGFIPLTLLVFALEPVLRGLAGHLKPIVTVGTAPGVALNWVVVPWLLLTLGSRFVPLTYDPSPCLPCGGDGVPHCAAAFATKGGLRAHEV